MKYHPDKNPAPEARQKFIQITQAYDNLLEGKQYATTSTFKSAAQKTPVPPKSSGKATDEKRHEKIASQHEQMMKKFMQVKNSLGAGDVLEKNRKKEYDRINFAFGKSAMAFLGGIILPFIIGQPGLLVISFSLGLGFGIRLFWQAGRRKMRADMLYGQENAFSLSELRDFFTTDRIGGINDGTDR